MTTQWGAPLTGAQMKLLRLPIGEPCWEPSIGWGAVYDLDAMPDDADYRLPADHPAYMLLEAGWLDGRNVRLWFGGDEAPDDWLEGSSVLLRDGCAGTGGIWKHYGNTCDIIAYIAKDDARTSPDTHSDRTIGRGLPNLPETVTIAKMTEAEASAWASKQVVIQPEHPIVMDVLGALGLIKETTREERFWAQHELEGATVPTHIKKWVKDALEFER